MSYEQVVNHLEGELRAGATRRQRRERRMRRVGAAVMAVAVIAGLTAVVALVDRDDASVVSTTPGTTTAISAPSTTEVAPARLATEADLAVCSVLVDFNSDRRIYNAERLEIAAADLRAAADHATDGEIRGLAYAIAAGGDDTISALSPAPGESGQTELSDVQRDAIKAHNRLTDLCISVGHPDFNPVIGDAPLLALPNVSLEDYGTPQVFERSAVLPVFGDVTRRLEIEGVVRSEAGGYFMRWREDDTNGALLECYLRGATVAGVDRTSSGCGKRPAVDDRTEILRDKLGDLVATFQITSDASFVVLDFETVRLVQQPVFGQTVFIWADHPDLRIIDAVLRTYDADGIELECVRYGSREC